MTKGQLAALRTIADGGTVSTRMRNILGDQGLLLFCTHIDYSKPIGARSTSSIKLSRKGQAALAEQS